MMWSRTTRRDLKQDLNKTTGCDLKQQSVTEKCNTNIGQWLPVRNYS